MYILLAILLNICSINFSFGWSGPKENDDFVYLDQVAPTILSDLKYHKNDNITGDKVAGCNGSRAVLTRDAAIAIQKVQEEFATYGYSLVVYSAYEPYKAYEHIDNWCKSNSNQINEVYYPNLTKGELQHAGYIKAKYSHSRGSTVDVTLIPLDTKTNASYIKQKKSYKDQNNNIIYLNDGTVDMGTSYDTLDPLSKYSHKSIPKASQANRKLLKNIMENHGFEQSEEFWWQFTLMREPYMDTHFDFDI